MSSETREIMHDQHSHPVHGTRTYWIIGGILFVVTALEIGAYYLEEILGPGVIPVILALSAAKFALVVMFWTAVWFVGGLEGCVAVLSGGLESLDDGSPSGGGWNVIVCCEGCS